MRDADCAAASAVPLSPARTASAWQSTSAPRKASRIAGPSSHGTTLRVYNAVPAGARGMLAVSGDAAIAVTKGRIAAIGKTAEIEQARVSAEEAREKIFQSNEQLEEANRTLEARVEDCAEDSRDCVRGDGVRGGGRVFWVRERERRGRGEGCNLDGGGRASGVPDPPIPPTLTGGRRLATLFARTRLPPTRSTAA